MDIERVRREAEEEEYRRLWNERKLRELEEKLSRIEREKQEEEARRLEQYEQQLRREEEKEARMREEEQKRLQLEAELCERRDELFNYKFGTKTGVHNFLGLQIEDVTQLRIAVCGPVGCGKSCFINTCYQTLRQTEKGAVLGQIFPGTVILQDHLPEMFFHLVDTWGFFNYNSCEVAEFENILTGKIQSGHHIVRSGYGQASAVQEVHQRPEFRQRVHGIIMVVKANGPRLRERVLRDYLTPFREILRETGKVLIIY